MEQTAQELNLKIPLSESNPVAMLACIHAMVRDGTYGRDYTIANREKNRRLRRDYNIDDARIKEILLDLRSEDFIKMEKSDNLLHPKDIVYIFKKKALLMPKWQENADYQQITLYIKITWPTDEAAMFIISFHEDNI